VSYKNQIWQCKARTKAGKRCRAPATAGGLCYFHANPAKAAEYGRIGGRKHGLAPKASFSEPIPKLENTSAVKEVVSHLIADLQAGKLNPRMAAGLASLLNLQLRLIQESNVEQRLARLERLLAESDLFKTPDVAEEKQNVTH
jgi:hypothetical protein